MILANGKLVVGPLERLNISAGTMDSFLENPCNRTFMVLASTVGVVVQVQKRASGEGSLQG
jgi:hypothetical protein